jgi:hypothetical protein
MNEIITPVTCFGLTNGIIDISPVGGPAPYQYTWFNSDFALSTQTQDLVNFPSDTFQLEMTDTNGCFYEMFWFIPQPQLLEASFTSDNVNCAGGSDGSILVDVVGGNGGAECILVKLNSDLSTDWSGQPRFFGRPGENGNWLPGNFARRVFPVLELVPGTDRKELKGYAFTATFNTGTNTMMGLVKTNTQGTMTPE